MNIALWVVQVVLAVLFGMAGFMKATQPKEKLVTNMKWTEDYAPGTLKAIGVLEVLAAVGLILPGLTGILPVLTPLAALGLVLTMIGAIIVHLRRKEYSGIIINLVLLALAVFVAYGRFVILPL